MAPCFCADDCKGQFPNALLLAKAARSLCPQFIRTCYWAYWVCCRHACIWWIKKPWLLKTASNCLYDTNGRRWKLSCSVVPCLPAQPKQCVWSLVVAAKLKCVDAARRFSRSKMIAADNPSELPPQVHVTRCHDATLTQIWKHIITYNASMGIWHMFFLRMHVYIYIYLSLSLPRSVCVDVAV